VLIRKLPLVSAGSEVVVPSPTATVAIPTRFSIAACTSVQASALPERRTGILPPGPLNAALPEEIQTSLAFSWLVIACFMYPEADSKAISDCASSPTRPLEIGLPAPSK